MNSGSSNSDEQLIDRRLTIRWGPTEEELIERQDTFNGSVPDETAAEIASLHGNSAAQRRAITELLFFACVGDLKRCQRIVRLWNLKVAAPDCCDYDKRTPLHLAASEGAYSVTEWLLAEGVNVNALDRFNRTPLEDAVRGDFNLVASLLMKAGGKVHASGKLIPLEDSELVNGLGFRAPQQKASGFALEWELDPSTIHIREKLGEGEFGVVHRAKWFGTVVAAKVLKASSEIAVNDFRAEIEILQRVHHPNCVQFLGACTAKEPYILVTELMSGGSLADAFRMPQAFPMRRALEIALDAARGLAYLHNRKPTPVIHRDLKPGNLMLSGSQYQDRAQVVFNTGVVKLADFGLSKTLPTNRHANFHLDERFKLTGETGSYRYMAPEVFRHEPYNSRVDVYSFSMIVYQLFEYQPPYADMDPVEAARLAALENARPNFITLAQPGPHKKELRELIERCWAPNADERPSFPEICRIIETLLAQIPRQEYQSSGAVGGDAGCCVVA
ncbi:Dual specificity protein kinase splA [Auxenochlorella protothecoides]|nr:Dual specificity protein kinase splA [Auxenochlorella protothecoides]KFM24164.1 Dual specificity protein kinase splA [Auxenochlorella protothecoides]